MVRSSLIMFLADRSYYFVFTNSFFKKLLYKFHVEKSLTNNNNEASKQNLSQQWIADRLINHNFSFNKSSFVCISFHLTNTARLSACQKNLSTSVFDSNLALTFAFLCIPKAIIFLLDAFYFEFSSFFGVSTNRGG